MYGQNRAIGTSAQNGCQVDPERRLAPSPERMPELPRVVDDLHTRIDILGKQLEALATRLTPVCAPTQKTRSDSPSEPTAITTVGASISGAALRLRVISENLSTLIESLEV